MTKATEANTYRVVVVGNVQHLLAPGYYWIRCQDPQFPVDHPQRDEPRIAQLHWESDLSRDDNPPAQPYWEICGSDEPVECLELLGRVSNLALDVPL